MRVAPGVEVLDISAVVMGRSDTIRPTLIWDEETVILIDAGYPGQLPLIRAAVAEAGVAFERIDKLILTHHDVDHIGSVGDILAELGPRVEVLAGEVEKPHVQGDVPSIRWTPEVIEQVTASLPPDLPEERRRAFRSFLENPPKAQVDRTLANGEKLAYCGGIVAIHTPGHTPGHICLYHEPSKTLVAGDLLRVRGGEELLGPLPEATIDMDEATRSLAKLSAYDIDAVICYHGGLYRGDANRRIAELARAGAMA